MLNSFDHFFALPQHHHGFSDCQRRIRAMRSSGATALAVSSAWNAFQRCSKSTRRFSEVTPACSPPVDLCATCATTGTVASHATTIRPRSRRVRESFMATRVPTTGLCGRASNCDTLVSEGELLKTLKNRLKMLFNGLPTVDFMSVISFSAHICAPRDVRRAITCAFNIA